MVCGLAAYCRRAIVNVMSKKSDIDEKSLKQWKLLDEFSTLMKKLMPQHPLSKSELDPRRKLSRTDYFGSLLFIMLNPVLDSMRGFCEISDMEKITKRVTSGKISLGSFSEAQSVFDPAILEQVLQELSKRVDLGLCDPRLKKLPKEVAAIDGTLLRALPRMAWALWQNDQNRSAKLHLKFSVTRQAVLDTLITTAKHCERKALKEMLDPDEFLIGDRYYGLDYGWLATLADIEQWFLFRVRNDACYKVVEDFEIAAEDRAAGVISDQMVTFGDNWKGGPTRLVKVQAFDEVLLLATSVMPEHMAAELISIAYRSRWQIELFFKWIKCILKNRHLLAESPQGVAIQTYCALIAAMMLFALTGRKPTKRDMELIQFYLCGMLSADELESRLKIKK